MFVHMNSHNHTTSSATLQTTITVDSLSGYHPNKKNVIRDPFGSSVVSVLVQAGPWSVHQLPDVQL